MAVYFITGKLGSGKSIAAVGKIRDYLNQGRAVATNLDLNLEKMVNPWAKNTKVTRIPDKPTVDDLENLPEPYEGDYDESKMGGIFLDECGTWFNTRDYRDKSRQPLINKLLHIRKAGWDVYFIIQHMDMIDKQVRDALGEHTVYCQRADKLAIPFITPLLKIFGLNIRPPKIHVGVVKYGTSVLSPTVDRWVYSGSDLYDAYDTRQVFGANDCGIYSYLSPYKVYGQFNTRKQLAREKYNEVFSKFKTFLKTGKRSFFLIGLTIGVTVNFFNGSEPRTATAAVKEKPVEQPETQEHKHNPLDEVRISAFILMSDAYEYYFVNDLTGDAYYPASDNYEVYAVNECKARLVGISETYTLTCKSKIGESSSAGARDVRPR